MVNSIALKVALAVLLTLSVRPASATSITIPYTFVPNTTIISAQVNANFSVIAGVVNGNLDNSNLSAGANISLSKLNNTQSLILLESSADVLGIGVGQTGDTSPRIGMYSDGTLQFGAGGSSVLDVGLERIAANVITPYVPSGATGTASLVGNIANSYVGGRLYLTTSSPLADHVATGTLFYGPYTSNAVTISNGSNQIPQTFAETSLSLSGLSTNTVYDIYITSASPTTISFVTTAWGGINTPPTRSVDSYGRSCKSGTPADLLIGAIYVNGSNQTVDIPAERFVSNLYNAVPRALYCTDTTASWTYASTTVRAANASTTDGIGRASFIQIQANLALDINTYCGINCAGANNNPVIGIGVNSTTVPSAIAGSDVGGGTYSGITACSYTGTALAGLNFLQRLEAAASGGTSTFYGTYQPSTATYTPANGLSSSVFN